MSKALPKWDDERTEKLKSVVGAESPVSSDTVDRAAEVLNTTARSVAAKLRKLGVEVASTAKDVKKAYTESEEAELRTFVENNANVFTYADIAARVFGGSRTAKQIQGKLLSMELTGLVKPTPKVEHPKSYTEAEEAKLLGLLKPGVFIEDVAAAMGREVASIRGKILSLSRTNENITIPKQRNVKETVDPIEALGDLNNLTVDEIAEKTGKSSRGVKTLLTRRALTCKNYDGAAKAAKNADKA